MIYNLCRTHNIQPPVSIHITNGTKRLHHCLLDCFHMIGFFHDNRTGRQLRFHIPVHAFAGGAKIPLHIRSYLTERFPVIFRMNDYRIVLCFMKIQYSRKHFIFCFDQFQCPVHTVLVFSSHNRHRVSYKTDMTVQNEPVIRTWFRISLSCQGKPVLGYVFPGIHRLDTGYLFCRTGLYRTDKGIGTGTAQQFHNKTVFSRQIFRKYRLSGNQSPGIYFSDWLPY